MFFLRKKIGSNLFQIDFQRSIGAKTSPDWGQILFRFRFFLHNRHRALKPSPPRLALAIAVQRPQIRLFFCPIRLSKTDWRKWVNNPADHFFLSNLSFKDRFEKISLIFSKLSLKDRLDKTKCRIIHPFSPICL